VKRAFVVGRRMLLAIGLLAVIASQPAEAGSYSVVGGCGNWIPHGGVVQVMTIYGACPGLVVRHVGGPFTTAWGVMEYWEFLPPSGSRIGRVSMSGHLTGREGWQASVMADQGLVLDRCPGAGCPGGSKTYSLATAPLGRARLLLHLWCSRIPSCPNDRGLLGLADAQTIVVEIEDATAPAVALVGGDLLSGWRRARGTVSLAASDNVGIKLDRLLVDGVPREQRARACSWGARIPCPNGAAGLSLDTTRIADGSHTLTVQAIDSADNIAGQSAVIRVDNTAPAAPISPTRAGGSGWRTTNDFTVSWFNPAQAHAPIAAARYRMCPIANLRADSRECVDGTRAAPNAQVLTNLAAPGPGAWRMRFWLVDAAGNENPAAAAESVLRFDNTPPAVVFHRPAPTDPARVRVTATDAVSSTASVAIEARRRGDDAWRALPTQPQAGDFVAFVDDERLQRGTYDLRARAVDAAGNERTTSSRDDGQAAVLVLPVRRSASLDAGLQIRHCARPHRCRSRLSSAPPLTYGRPVTLHGVLRIAGRRAPGPVEVWRRVKIAGAAWERVAIVSASSRGAFQYVIGAGPARRYRFRFAGSATTRGATAFVDARVRAATMIDVSRRDVVNGEYVTFRGRLRGGRIPTTGKLVELQVFTRRRWRTFALPRADAKTGRWSFQYRFETISGLARFRFRARIQREAGYPFHTGTSRQIEVTVHGI
jgi:hypothetical protein